MRWAIVGLLTALSLLGAVGPTTPPAQASEHLGDHLYPGESMYAGDSLVSANGAYQFLLQEDGNAVVYDAAGSPLWASRTFSDIGRVTLGYDGEAVVEAFDGSPRWQSGTSGQYAMQMVMQDDGNLVIYGVLGNPTWASRYDSGAIWVGSVLTAGRSLSGGQYLSLGSYRLTMQRDGNVVLRRNGAAVWHTRTYRNPGATLVMQPDGNLVVYNASGRAVWHTRTYGRPGSFLRVQTDGNLVIYRSDGRPSWSRWHGRY